MMNEQEFITSAERYLNEEMDSAERSAFEQYCEQDHAAAERLATHRLFLQQLKDHADRVVFKRTLSAVMADHQAIPVTTIQRQPLLVTLWNKYKINSLIAASVAVVAVFSTLWLSGYYQTILKTTTNYSELKRDMNTVKKNVNAQNAVIRNINSEKQRGGQAESHFGATGFLLSANGYVVTNYHVIKGADSVHLQNTKGELFRADVIYEDPSNDVAMLYIRDSTFKALKTTPYTFKESPSELGEDVYTIGFPRDEVVYGQGYLSSRTGYAGDTTAYQLSIPVNPGNSGGPVLDSKGNVIGIISGKQTGIDGASFAIKTEALLKSISAIPMDSLASKLTINKRNTLNGLRRTEQIKRVQDYVYLVRVF